MYKIIFFLSNISSFLLIIFILLSFIRDDKFNLKIDNILINKLKLFDLSNKIIFIIFIFYFILHLISFIF